MTNSVSVYSRRRRTKLTQDLQGSRPIQRAGTSVAQRRLVEALQGPPVSLGGPYR